MSNVGKIKPFWPNAALVITMVGKPVRVPIIPVNASGMAPITEPRIIASIASLIAMAGDKVIMPENAMMMIHNPWTCACRNANDFRKLADDLDKIRDSMIVAYKNKSGLSDDEIKDIMDAETWLSAKDCLDKGFADEIEEAKEVAACVDEKYFGRYKNVPENLKEPPKEPPGQAKEVRDSEKELRKRKILLELEL